MAFLQLLGTLGLAHLILHILIYFLIACFLGRMILSWLAMAIPSLHQGNPFVRFFNNITGPLYDPLYRVMPGSSSVGAFDLRGTIAFIFSWWALIVFNMLLTNAIPKTW